MIERLEFQRSHMAFIRINKFMSHKSIFVVGCFSVINIRNIIMLKYFGLLLPIISLGPNRQVGISIWIYCWNMVNTRRFTLYWFKLCDHFLTILQETWMKVFKFNSSLKMSSRFMIELRASLPLLVEAQHDICGLL